MSHGNSPVASISAARGATFSATSSRTMARIIASSSFAAISIGAVAIRPIRFHEGGARSVGALGRHGEGLHLLRRGGRRHSERHVDRGRRLRAQRDSAQPDRGIARAGRHRSRHRLEQLRRRRLGTRRAARQQANPPDHRARTSARTASSSGSISAASSRSNSFRRGRSRSACARAAAAFRPSTRRPETVR